MGLKSMFSRIFKKQSAVTSMQSMEPAIASIEESIPSPPRPKIKPRFTESTQEYIPNKIEVEQDSLQLGLAAGYTGKSIREIESSLSRIESQMASKDWVSLKMDEQFKMFQEYIGRRLELIESSLTLGGKVVHSGMSTQPTFTKLPLSPRMESVLLTVKDVGQVSYEDLALKLDMSISDLRSILSHMTKRTDQIERIKIGRRGWVKYNGEAIQSQ